MLTQFFLFKNYVFNEIRAYNTADFSLEYADVLQTSCYFFKGYKSNELVH